MSRGRKPTPTKLHVLRGNPSKKKDLGAGEPEPSPVVSIEPPDFLREEAKRAWFLLAPEFQAQGILTKSDAPALAAFCSAWGDFVNADRALETEGDIEVVFTKSGEIRRENPWHYIKARALQQCDKYATQFGVGASYRAKLSIAPPKKKSKYEEWKEQAQKIKGRSE